MWSTSVGDRILRGSESELFRHGLGTLRDRIEEAGEAPELCETGVAVFDRLQPASKLAMIALVGRALSDDNEPSPPLTALTEGTFAAVYATIRQEIEFEIDMRRQGPQPEDAQSSVRPLVLAAVRETNPDWENPLPEPESDDLEFEPASLPTPESEDFDAWDFLLDVLINRVLWGDRDFEGEEYFLDNDPRESEVMKLWMGIDRDYFSAIPPEPTELELAAIRKTLRQLCVR
jgi:hypothetical protein